MTFRADGTSVVNVDQGNTSGVALAFDPDMARQIAEALNKYLPGAGGRGKVDPLTGKTVEQIDRQDPRMLSDVIGKDKVVRITGVMATAQMGTPDGRQVRSLAEGAILPGDVTAGQARHLVDVGLAEVVDSEPVKPPVEEPTEPASTETDDGGDKPPPGNASRDAWAAYAASKGAPEGETRPVAEGGLSHADLRAKYGS